MQKRNRDLPKGFPFCSQLIRKALLHENIKELRRLLELKCDPNYECPLNRVFFISNHDSFEAVKLLLEYKADPNKRAYHLKTAAMDCVRYDKVNILELLIQHKADINLQSAPQLLTCLDYALGWQTMDCSMLLLKHGGKRMETTETDFVVNVRKEFRLFVIDQVWKWTNIEPRDVIVIIVDYFESDWQL